MRVNEREDACIKKETASERESKKSRKRARERVHARGRIEYRETQSENKQERPRLRK